MEEHRYEHRYEIHPFAVDGPDPAEAPVAEADSVGGAWLAVETLRDDGDDRALAPWDADRGRWLRPGSARISDAERDAVDLVASAGEIDRDRDDDYRDAVVPAGEGGW
jgi:hypothetical protein